MGTAGGHALGVPLLAAFWGRMQVELLNRRRWKTRIELAISIHDYIELFHNTPPPPQRARDDGANRIRDDLLADQPSRLTPDP